MSQMSALNELNKSLNQIGVSDDILLHVCMLTESDSDSSGSSSDSDSDDPETEHSFASALFMQVFEYSQHCYQGRYLIIYLRISISLQKMDSPVGIK